MNEVLMTVPDPFPSLFWGYAVLWSCIVLYLIYLGSRLNALEKKIEVDTPHGQSS